MDKRRVRVKAMKVAFLAVVMSLAASTTSYAGLVNLAPPTPDMTAQQILSRFDPLTGLFTAIGWHVTPANVFNLSANFSGGVLKAENLIPTTATLLIGSGGSLVSATDLAVGGFAISDNGKTIEFIFNTVAGTSGLFSSGAPLDVQITLSSFAVGGLNTFSNATGGFNSGGTAKVWDTPTDTVPEPSALLALIVGGGGLLLRRRRAARTIA